MPSCPRLGCGFTIQTDWGQFTHSRRCAFRSPLAGADSQGGGRRKRRRAARPPPLLGGDADSAYDSIAAAEATGDALRKAAAAVEGGSRAGRGDASGQERASSELAMALSEATRAAGSKCINGVIRCLAAEDFSLANFLSRVKSASDCKGVVSSILMDAMETEGFRRRPVSEEGLGEFVMHAKCPLQVLRAQVSSSTFGDTLLVSEESRSAAAAEGQPYSQSAPERLYRHPVDAELGVIGGSAVRSAIEGSPSPDVIWSSLAEDGRRSFVGYAQIYTDKSVTTMKASGLTFYPLHLTLLNFSESHRRRQIVSGATIVGYLPTEFDVEVDADDDGDGSGGCPGVSREQRIKLIHLAIHEMLQPLSEAAACGLECADGGGMPLLCHICVGSYVCDIPEAKDLTSVLHGANTRAPCHRCLVDKDSLSYPGTTAAPLRTLLGTTSALASYHQLVRDMEVAKASGGAEQARSLRDKSSETLRRISISKQPPALSQFPFVGLVPCLDLYVLYSFEPLHNVLLGLWKLLMNASSARLTSKGKHSEAILTAAGRPRSLSSIRPAVLARMNKILAAIERDSPARGLRVDFSSKDKGVKYNGLFKADGIAGMLEAKDMRSVSMIAVFIGAYFDRCSGEADEAPVTRVFALFARVIDFAHRRGAPPEWSEQQTAALEEMIAEFKREAVRVLGPHQTSGMGTLKFHLLDHLPADIRRLGGICFADPGLFEFAHTIFKAFYRGTSRRAGTGMDETIFAISATEAAKQWERAPGEGMGGDKRAVRGARIQALESDAGMLARGGERVPLEGVRAARAEVRRSAGLSPAGGQTGAGGAARALLSDIGGNGARVLVDCVTDLVRVACGPCAVEGIELEIAKSAFVPGLPCPTPGACVNAAGAVTAMDAGTRINQRVVASRSFYGDGRARFDCVMIGAETASATGRDGRDKDCAEALEGPDSASDAVTASRVAPVYFAKVLALFRVLNGPSGRRKLVTNEEGEDLQLALVRYFDTSAAEDGVDRAVDCLKLRWSRGETQGGDDAQRVPEDYAGWFDVVPVASLRGVVHVVRGDYELEETVAQKQRHPRDREYFYVNRWYTDPREMRYSLQLD